MIRTFCDECKKEISNTGYPEPCVQSTLTTMLYPDIRGAGGNRSNVCQKCFEEHILWAAARIGRKPIIAAGCYVPPEDIFE